MRNATNKSLLLLGFVLESWCLGGEVWRHKCDICCFSSFLFLEEALCLLKSVLQPKLGPQCKLYIGFLNSVNPF